MLLKVAVKRVGSATDKAAPDCRQRHCQIVIPSQRGPILSRYLLKFQSEKIPSDVSLTRSQFLGDQEIFQLFQVTFTLFNKYLLGTIQLIHHYL